MGFYNVDPGFVVTETMEAQGMTAEFAARFGAVPPQVPAAAIAWLATAPEASAWQGRSVFAAKLCRELGLLPGWPEAP